jgi:hypothetical protein
VRGYRVRKTLLLGAAVEGIVVQLAPEHPAAEVVPVVARIQHVQVPGFIDGVRRREGANPTRNQEQKAPVLHQHAPGVVEGPTVLGRQPLEELLLRAGLPDGEGHDPVVQGLGDDGLFGCGHDVCLR